MGFHVHEVPRYLSKEEIFASSILDGYQPPSTDSVDRNARVSHRHGQSLSLSYGYPDLGSFIEDIPPEAEVIDVGAGASTLGLEVCRQRPDVRWLNTDINYDDPFIMSRLKALAPPNLRFLPADVLELVEAVEGQRFDRVYSFWMLRHVELRGRSHGVAAAENILSLAKQPGGQISVGPVFMLNRTTLPKPSKHASTVRLEAPLEPAQTRDLAERLVDATAARGLFRATQKVLNSKAWAR